MKCSGSPGGRCSPALNTPLARNWRPLAALTAGLVVGVFVGFSLVGSRTATSAQPEPAAVNPPVVGDTTDAVGIPYQGTGPAAEIIRGSYRDELAAPKAPVAAARPPALASRIRAPGRRPTSSAAGATPPTGDASRAVRPGRSPNSKPRLHAGLACCLHRSRLARRTAAVPIQMSFNASTTGTARVDPRRAVAGTRWRSGLELTLSSRPAICESSP